MARVTGATADPEDEESAPGCTNARQTVGHGFDAVDVEFGEEREALVDIFGEGAPQFKTRWCWP